MTSGGQHQKRMRLASNSPQRLTPSIITIPRGEWMSYRNRALLRRALGPVRTTLETFPAMSTTTNKLRSHINSYTRSTANRGHRLKSCQRNPGLDDDRTADPKLVSEQRISGMEKDCELLTEGNLAVRQSFVIDLCNESSLNSCTPPEGKGFRRPLRQILRRHPPCLLCKTHVQLSYTVSCWACMKCLRHPPLMKHPDKTRAQQCIRVLRLLSQL